VCVLSVLSRGFLSRSVCVRAKRFNLSDHHWKQALVALVPTRNCPASCPHAYLSRIESSRANGVQRQRRRTPVHVEGGPTGWAAPAAQSDCAHGCTIARLVPARDHPQTRIWSGTAHSVRILDAPGSQTDEFNEKHNGPQRFPLVLWNTRPPSEPGTWVLAWMAAKSGLEEHGGKKFGQNRAAAGPCGWVCCGLRNAGRVGSSLASDNRGDHIMMDLLCK
jgi:hypothetical protein